MRTLISLIFLLLVVSCGEGAGQETPHSKSEMLRIINRNTHNWAMRVGVSSTNDPDFSSSVGDSVLFDGLLCMSGDETSCESVRQSQGPQGMWWRAPTLIEQPYGSGSITSRDVALGALAYLAYTRDREAAARWEDFIRSRGYHLCSEAERNCDITPPLWSVFFWVWDRVGLEPMNLMRLHKFTYRTLEGLAGVADPDVALHLIGVEALILRSLDVDGSWKISSRLAGRQPENPFYQYLNGSYDRAADLVLEQCPMSQPERRFYWRWQRPYPLNDPEKELGSGGWDCIFMTNMLLKDGVGL